MKLFHAPVGVFHETEARAFPVLVRVEERGGDDAPVPPYGQHEAGDVVVELLVFLSLVWSADEFALVLGFVPAGIYVGDCCGCCLQLGFLFGLNVDVYRAVSCSGALAAAEGAPVILRL